MSTKTIRNIREPLKKPRPLKSVSTEQMKFHAPDPKDSVIQKSRDEILADLEILNVSISNCNFDEVTVMDIARMCAILKKRGEELDTYHREAIDRFFCTLRNAGREERLDMISRVKLLETIELRARNWKRNDNINNYFNSKIMELEQKGNEGYNYSNVTSPTIPFPVPNQNLASPPVVPLGPGEILRSSGKFEKPTKIAGKNFFKDEIVIRNSDSGKVNPGARDRLVQITGPHEEAIGHAKLLVEDTIRRNASPVRDNADISGFENRESVDFGNYQSIDNQPYAKKSLQHSYSLSDASLREYSFSLEVGQDFLTLTGTNAELLKTAKLVLKEYFAGQSEFLEKHENLNRHPSPDYSVPPRFELRKQSSIKTNMENNYPPAWRNPALKRDSVSPFSSSDDDIEKMARNGVERDFPSHNFVTNQTSGKYRNSESLESTNTHAGKFTRSSSVPCDALQAITTFPEIEPMRNDEVFSPLLPPELEAPPIPPPSYKPLKYEREFLLRCAKSPFSHNQPPNFPHIHQNFKEIICQSPVMFDPEKYEESRLDESTVCVLK